MNAIGPNALAGVVKPQHTGKKSEDPLLMSKFVLDNGIMLGFYFGYFEFKNVKK